MNQSAESNDSIISLKQEYQEHSRTSRTLKNIKNMKNIKNTIEFRENISNLCNALGREEIWAAKRCQNGMPDTLPKHLYIYYKIGTKQ